MPWNRKLYPPNWEEIALAIKTEVNWTCESCDRPCRMPGETPYEFFKRLEAQYWTWVEDLEALAGNGDYVFKFGRFTLTVAHLDHEPSNCDRNNLKALCAPCHCRYDLSQMARKRMLKRERAGQLSLGLVAGDSN